MTGLDAFIGRGLDSFGKSPLWARGLPENSRNRRNVLYRAYDRGVKPFGLPYEQWSDLLYQRQTWRILGNKDTERTDFDYTFTYTIGTRYDPASGQPQYDLVQSGEVRPDFRSIVTGVGALIVDAPDLRFWDLRGRTGTPLMDSSVGSISCALDQPAPIGLMEAKNAILRAAFQSSQFKYATEDFWEPRYVLLPDNSFLKIQEKPNDGGDPPGQERPGLGPSGFGQAIAYWAAEELPYSPPNRQFPFPVGFGGLAPFQDPLDMVRSISLMWSTLHRDGPWAEMEYDGIAPDDHFYSWHSIKVPGFVQELSCARHQGAVDRVEAPPAFATTMLTRSALYAPLEGGSFGLIPSGGRGRIIFPLELQFESLPGDNLFNLTHHPPPASCRP